jgi:hypothetical protein
MTYGGFGTTSDLSNVYWGPTTTTAVNHNTDTLRVIIGRHDYPKNAVQGANAIVVKVPITATTALDTLASGFNYLQIPIGLNVPAGQKATATVFFKSGDTWQANVDTVLAFNHVRMYSFEENTNALGTYTKGDYNCSHIMTHDTVGWGVLWKPSFAFTAPYRYENHFFSYHVTSASALPIVSSLDDAPAAVKFDVVPNPTQGDVRVYGPSGAQITVTDVSGKVLTKIASANTTEVITTARYGAGIYFINVSKGGRSSTQRIIVE